MKTTLVIMAVSLALISVAHAEDESPAIARLRQQGVIVKALHENSPVIVTNHAAFRARLEHVVSGVEDSKWNQKSQVLPSVPKSARDAAMGLRTSLQVSIFLATEYKGYYILSDVGILGDPFSLDPADFPTSSPIKLKTHLETLVTSHADSFMSGFVVPKGTDKWMKYDFRRTYMLTPTGVSITTNRIADRDRDAHR